MNIICTPGNKHLGALRYNEVFICELPDGCDTSQISISPTDEFAIIYGYNRIDLYYRDEYKKHIKTMPGHFISNDAPYYTCKYGETYIATDNYIVEVTHLDRCISCIYYNFDGVVVDNVQLPSNCYYNMVRIECFIDEMGRNRINWASDCCNAICDYIVVGDTFVPVEYTRCPPYQSASYMADALDARNTR